MGPRREGSVTQSGTGRRESEFRPGSARQIIAEKCKTKPHRRVLRPRFEALEWPRRHSGTGTENRLFTAILGLALQHPRRNLAQSSGGNFSFSTVLPKM